MKKKQPTMKDVAKLAGVTQPTVSYVINGTATISDDVKERVYHAIQELGYKPNYNAIALKTKRSHVIGIIIPDITNAYYSVMGSLLEKQLTKEGYTVLINSTGYKEQVERLIIEKLLSHNVEAFIVTYQFSNVECWKMLKESGKEVVVIEAGAKAGIFPQIETDNYYGAYIATEYLVKNGRKKVAYIGQKSNIDALKNREKGYEDVIKKYSRQESLILKTDVLKQKWEEGIIIGKQLLQSDIDGIVVSSDEIAVGILKTLLSSGVNVPLDKEIIGYDDIPVAKLFIPELTTIHQPVDDICENAVKMLLKAVRGEHVDSIMLKPELKIRKTTQ